MFHLSIWIGNPGLFLFVNEDYSNSMKPSAMEVMEFANKIILTNGKNHQFNLSNILIENSEWKLKML